MTLEIYNESRALWYDITDYITWQGLSFSRNDVDGPDAGRTMDGIMRRSRVGVKEKMQVKTIPLTRAQAKFIEQLIYPESFQVRVTPYHLTNAAHVMNMYSNNVSISYIIHRSGGEDLTVLSFPLIEN